ncbi:MAG: sulfatase-like hydrolase/transferase [Symbiopectobacterium sp.]
MYLSHGESLGKDGVDLHSMPYAVAPSQQTHIPILMWSSHDFQQQFAVEETCLRQRAQTQCYSQDNLFQTISGNA